MVEREYVGDYDVCWRMGWSSVGSAAHYCVALHCQDDEGDSGGTAGLSKSVGMQENLRSKKRRGKKRSGRSNNCGGALEGMDSSDTGRCGIHLKMSTSLR